MTAILAYQLGAVALVFALCGAGSAYFDRRRERRTEARFLRTVGEQVDRAYRNGARWEHHGDLAESPHRTYTPAPPGPPPDAPPSWCCEWGERAWPGLCPWHPPEPMGLPDQWPPPDERTPR